MIKAFHPFGQNGNDFRLQRSRVKELFKIACNSFREIHRRFRRNDPEKNGNILEVFFDVSAINRLPPTLPRCKINPGFGL